MFARSRSQIIAWAASGAIVTAVGLVAHDTAIVLSIITLAMLRVMANFKAAKDLQDEGG
ncbi:hypothetical protein D3C71_971960 [compost metagenome]